MPGPDLTPEQQQQILDKAAAEGLPLVVPSGYSHSIIMPRGPSNRRGSMNKLLGALGLAPASDNLLAALARPPGQEATCSPASGDSPKVSAAGAISLQGPATAGGQVAEDGGAVKLGIMARIADAVGMPGKASA